MDRFQLRATRAPSGTHAAITEAGPDAQGSAEVQERLRILVMVALGSFAAVGILAWLVPLFSPPATPATTGMGLLAAQVMILCSGMLYLLRRQRGAATLHWVGLGFVVLVAAVMAFAEVTLSPEIGGARWGVSGIGIWIVLFPLVAPAPPRLTLVAALACASAAPVAHVLGLLAGLPEVGAARLFAWFLPLYFCAGLAVVAATGIHRYRTALAAARKELRDLGRYQLVRRLGGGGMGEVWIARHRLLPRSAAIKFIRLPAGDDPRRREILTRQFEAEAAAIARLSSLHTVTLYDFGVSEEGEWYSVMELLDGLDLQQAVEDHGRFPDWRVVRLLAQACRSLAEAHHRGLVHRDVTPGNLMLCRQGDELDVVKVVDFGLVGGLAGTPGHSPVGGTGGQSTTWAGSIGYVAPEVLLGGEAADGRTDLYALGCVAWWLITGHTVFPDAASEKEECILHCMQPPPPLAVACDPGLAALVLDLLAKRPEQRPADAGTVRRRLLGLACWQGYDEAAVAAWWQPVKTLAGEPGESAAGSPPPLAPLG